jgi:serpin B
VEGNNRFAFDLYARLSDGTGNVCVSPFSLATGMTVVSAGARGETAEQLVRVLHQPADTAAVCRAYGTLLESLSGTAGPRGVRLSFANSLWGTKDSSFLPEYLALIKGTFKSSLVEVDFMDDPETARQTVNAWVMEQTGGKVTELFKPGDIDGATQLVLANVLTFQGDWSSLFKKEQTTLGAFRTSGGEPVQVPYMHQTGRFRIAGSGSGRALAAPGSMKNERMQICPN